MYAVHPVALSEVKALHRHAPPLGAHKIVLTLFNGVSLSPLYFQHVGGGARWGGEVASWSSPPQGCCSLPESCTSADPLPPNTQGGTKSLMSALREHVLLARSASDANTYLVNDQADPLQRSLSTLGMLDAPPPGSTIEAGGVLRARAPGDADDAWGAVTEAEAEPGVLAHVAELLDRFHGLALSARDTGEHEGGVEWGVLPSLDTQGNCCAGTSA